MHAGESYCTVPSLAYGGDCEESSCDETCIDWDMAYWGDCDTGDGQCYCWFDDNDYRCN